MQTCLCLSTQSNRESRCKPEPSRKMQSNRCQLPCEQACLADRYAELLTPDTSSACLPYASRRPLCDGQKMQCFKMQRWPGGLLERQQNSGLPSADHLIVLGRISCGGSSVAGGAGCAFQPPFFQCSAPPLPCGGSCTRGTLAVRPVHIVCCTIASRYGPMQVASECIPRRNLTARPYALHDSASRFSVADWSSSGSLDKLKGLRKVF